MRVVVAFLALASCVGSDLATCSDADLICPPGDVCAPAGGRCVAKEQVDACARLTNHEACTALGFTGSCQDGLCEVTQAEPFNVRVSLPGAGSGRVTSQPPAIDCGSTCSAAFPIGTHVVLSAEAQNASTFGGWNGPCAGTGTCELTVTAAITVSAFFLLPAPPTIKEVEPRTGVGVGGHVVITGTGFSGITAVTVDGVAQPQFTVTSPTTIETVVPQGARTGPITVVGPGGSASSMAFTVLLADVKNVQGLDTALGGCSDLVITVAQAESLPADVRVELDPGTNTFQPATSTSASAGLLHVATSPEGISYAFHWDTTRDVPHEALTVKLRASASVSNTAGSVGQTITRDIEIANGAELAPPTSFDYGFAQPDWWQVVDVNGDGHVDVVTGTYFGPTVVTLLGDGKGGFSAPIPIVIPYGTLGTYGQVADLNGDGAPDFVITDSGSLWTYVGNGDGTFTAGPRSTVPGDPMWIEVVDFDGDGRPDVLFQTDTDLDLRVAHGLGDGTFSAPEVIAAPLPGFGAPPFIGDTNRDDRVDLVIPEFDVLTDTLSIEVFLGTGGGWSTTSVRTRVSDTLSFALLSDLDMDGTPDLVVGNQTAGTVLLGNGDGTFRPGATFLQWNTWSATTVGDVDLDGKPDLISVARAQRMAIVVTSPSGALEGSVVLPDQVIVRRVAVADLDSDGRPDVLVLGDNTIFASMNVTARSCQRSFAARQPIQGSFDGPMVAADVNRDGKLDLLFAGAGGTMTVVLGRGDGTFDAPTSIPGSPSTDSSDQIVVDMNGDGRPDIVTAISFPPSVFVALQNSDGTFAAPNQYPLISEGDNVGATYVGLVAADFDRDGRVDIAVVEDEKVVVLMANASGFEPAITIGDASYSGLVAGDFDGDGRPDLAASGLGGLDSSGTPITTVTVFLSR